MNIAFSNKYANIFLLISSQNLLDLSGWTRRHALFRLGHMLSQCCISKLHTVFRSMMSLIRCAIIREFWLQFAVQHRQAETAYHMQTALETRLWLKHSSGMCCPISKTNTPTSGVTTSIPVCQDGSSERSMRLIRQRFSLLQTVLTGLNIADAKRRQSVICNLISRHFSLNSPSSKRLLLMIPPDCLHCCVAYYSADWMPLALCRSVGQHAVPFV